MATIFIVEDEKDIRELIAFTLRYANHSVVTFANGDEVLHQINKELPQLFILDVRMPGISGIELCQILKKDHRCHHIPVLFLSAKGQKEEISAGLEAGADDYILKPFVPETLNQKVQQVLKDHQGV